MTITSFRCRNPAGSPVMGASISRSTGDIPEWSAHTTRAGVCAWREAPIRRRYRPPQVEEWTELWVLTTSTGVPTTTNPWGQGPILTLFLPHVGCVLPDHTFCGSSLWCSKWGWGEGSAPKSNQVSGLKNNDDNHFWWLSWQDLLSCS